jgi:Tfp pilus assembly protein PilF
LARAEELFTKAAARDPQSAQVQEALGDLGAVRALYRGLASDSFESELAQGEAAARRALELDPELSQPLAALGLIALMRTDWAEAERDFKQSLDRAPNNATAHDWYADLLHETGRLDRAIEEYRKAEQLDPLAFYIMSDLGWCLTNARRFAEALPVLDRAESFVPGTVRIGLQRAYALAELGQPDQARVVMGHVLPALVGGETTARAPNAVYVLQRLGQQNEARQFVQTMLNRLPTEKNYIRGAILLVVGRSDEGFAVLEKTPVFGGHSRWLFWDPEFDPVRDDPRFQRLLERLNSAENYKVARETLARMLKEQAAAKK